MLSGSATKSLLAPSANARAYQKNGRRIEQFLSRIGDRAGSTLRTFVDSTRSYKRYLELEQELSSPRHQAQLAALGILPQQTGAVAAYVAMFEHHRSASTTAEDLIGEWAEIGGTQTPASLQTQRQLDVTQVA
ncbi:MAG: hypothetical protein WD073_07285 [Xanthobacteraceae bacterium]